MFEFSKSIFVADLLGIPPAAEIDFGSYTGEPKAGDIVALCADPCIAHPWPLLVSSCKIQVLRLICPMVLQGDLGKAPQLSRGAGFRFCGGGLLD